MTIAARATIIAIAVSIVTLGIIALGEFVFVVAVKGGLLG
jgi:hypothetical protein